MFEILSDFFRKSNISCFSPLPLGECRIIRPYLLTRAGIGNEGTAVLFAVPYLTEIGSSNQRNLSSYAVPPDYHVFFNSLFDEILPLLRSAYPKHRFGAFADHSPLDEVHAAARAGLGVIGKNGLLITPAHSSYVFLGEIITDMVLPCTSYEPSPCEGCGKCERVCPARQDLPCLSALTQKKGTLTAQEEAYLQKGSSVWGCDLCQEVCPHTKKALKNGTLYTSIPYFTSAPIPYLTRSVLNEMPNGDFSRRAYAWRGKETIERNLCIFEKGDPKC